MDFLSHVTPARKPAGTEFVVSANMKSLNVRPRIKTSNNDRIGFMVFPINVELESTCQRITRLSSIQIETFPSALQAGDPFVLAHGLSAYKRLFPDAHN